MFIFFMLKYYKTHPTYCRSCIHTIVQAYNIIHKAIDILERRKHKFIEHSWRQFFARFLYGASVHVNLDRRTPVRLSNRVIAFNQSKRSEWFRRIMYFISLRLKWQCSKRNGPCFSCASIELWMHLGSWKSTKEARQALGFASCHSNASLVLSQLPACIHNSIYAR